MKTIIEKQLVKAFPHTRENYTYLQMAFLFGLKLDYTKILVICFNYNSNRINLYIKKQWENFND